MSTVLEALTGHPYPVPDVNDGQQSTHRGHSYQSESVEIDLSISPMYRIRVDLPISVETVSSKYNLVLWSFWVHGAANGFSGLGHKQG